MKSGFAALAFLAFFAAGEAYDFKGCDNSMSNYVTVQYPPKCSGSNAWDPQTFADYLTCRDGGGLDTQAALPDCYAEVLKSVNGEPTLTADSSALANATYYLPDVCSTSADAVTDEQAQRFYCCVMFHSLELSDPLLDQYGMETIDKGCYNK